MSVITHIPPVNIWDAICKDIGSRYSPPKDDTESELVKTPRVEYDSSIHHPAFYGKMHKKIDVDGDPLMNFDPAIGHPSVVGHALLDRPDTPPPPSPPPPPPKDTCSPTDYLTNYIFPVLLPAIEKMLTEARSEKCFERKRTKFNALDFLAAYLYNKNTQHTDRGDVELTDIPFVQEWLVDHPRPPLPKSLIWSDAEATLIIQSHWRAFKVRREPEIQELRQWQREWREENSNIKEEVTHFWAEKIPDVDDASDVEQEVNPVESDDVEIPATPSATSQASATTPKPTSPEPSEEGTGGEEIAKPAQFISTNP